MSKDYKKLYEQALSKARAFSQRWQGIEVTDSELAFRELKEIFPELAESENERIRKEIINYFKCQSRNEPARKDIHNKWIAWLEKQDEQKPTWSEEDKENISMLIDLVESKEESMEVKIELSAWLKSLKERMQLV